MKKPTPEEFELADGCITHRPTGHRFVSMPGNPSKGLIEPGYQSRTADYDAERVKEMALRLWAKHIAG